MTKFQWRFPDLPDPEKDEVFENQGAVVARLNKEADARDGVQRKPAEDIYGVPLAIGDHVRMLSGIVDEGVPADQIDLLTIVQEVGHSKDGTSFVYVEGLDAAHRWVTAPRHLSWVKTPNPVLLPEEDAAWLEREFPIGTRWRFIQDGSIDEIREIRDGSIFVVEVERRGRPVKPSPPLSWGIAIFRTSHERVEPSE